MPEDNKISILRYAPAAVVAGIGLLFCGPTQILAVTVVVLGCACIAADLAARNVLGPRRRYATLAFAGTVLTLVCLGSLFLRHTDRGDYVTYNGTRITAATDLSSCTRDTADRFGTVTRFLCDATWTAGGDRHTGTIEVAGDAHRRVTGYAYGDLAVSGNDAWGNPAARITVVPPWPGLIGLVLLAAGVFGGPRDRASRRVPIMAGEGE